MNNNRIALLCGRGSTVTNFRLELINDLIRFGFDVSVICLDNENQQIIESHNVHFFSVNRNNRSINPFDKIVLVEKYKKIIKQINPSICFSFMVTPNIFGILGAKKAGVRKLFSMVEGAGDAFANNSLKWRIIRFFEIHLYKKSFKNVSKVFFLNSDDRDEFIKRNIVVPSKSIVIPGIGVDLNRFKQEPISNHSTFLMIARMTEKKGVFDYCRIAREVKKNIPNAKFLYLGEEFTLKVKDIQEYIDDGSIIYLGVRQDVREIIKESSALILPSTYREGFPRVIMESQAVGRCVIAYDNVGSRDGIIDGYNGFLCEPRNYMEIVEKCIFLLNNKKTLETMGNASRQYAIDHFDSKKINKIILSIIDK